MTSVSILDYGVGNLLSVSRALEACGATPNLISTPEAVLSADRLVLPGVGAFKDGMDSLSSTGMVEPLNEFCKSGKAFLGICLGMQMMLDESEEFGVYDGLGLIKGRVKEIPDRDVDGKLLKIPHIGWNALIDPGREEGWQDTILSKTNEGEFVYFVHSFMAVPENKENVLAECDYGGVKICAAVENENLFGTQFHPEKSGQVGLSIVSAFLEI